VANENVRIKARIHLLTAEEGGRRAPLVGGTSYRPNHNFFDSDNREMAMGAIDLLPNETFRPGATFDKEMTLFIWPELKREIVAGRHWTIQEGAKIVGKGTILEVTSI